MPCRAADSRSSKKMFEEIIFSRFGIPRMVISDGGSHFIDKAFNSICQNMESIIMLLLCITLRQVAR
jgi:hypothetical protein